MKERIIRMDLTDLEKILKEQGSIKKDEFLNDAHIEPGELVLRVLSVISQVNLPPLLKLNDHPLSQVN
jgi:hypothetical protein